jgi:hypothetical protein
MATPLDVQIAYSETMEELTATSRKFEELIRNGSMRQLVDFNKELIGSATAFNSLASKITQSVQTLDKFNTSVKAGNTTATMLYMGQALSSAGRSLIDLRDKIYQLQNQLGTTFATAVDSGTAAFTNQITSLFTAGPALSFKDSIDAINAFQKEFGTLLTRGAAADIAKSAKQFGTDVGVFVRAQRAFLVGPNSLANQAKLQQQFITQFRAAGLTANQALTFAANNANLVAIAGVKYADSLARAAANATKIGVSLEKTEGFADTLVGDFEGGLERISELRAMGVEVDFNELARIAGTGTPEEVFNELSRQLGGNNALLDQVQRNRFLKVAIERDLGLSIADVRRLAAGPGALPGEETKPEENQGGFLAGLTKIIGPFAKVGGILATAMGLQTMATIGNTMALMKNTGASMAQALGLKTGGGGLTGLGTAAKGLGIAGGIAGVGMGTYGAYQSMKAGDKGGALANVLMSTLSGVGTGAMIGGGPIGALVGGLIGLGSGIISMAAASDIAMGPGRGRVLLGPEGAFSLNPKDSILAGTDLFKQANDMAYVNPASPTVERLASPQTMTAQQSTTTNVNVDMSKLESKLDKLASAFSAIKIEMDGNTVGRVSLNARSPLDRLSVVG